MTLEDQLVFDLTIWKSISLGCKDLLSKMLTKDPDQRISMKAVYEHNFFASVRDQFVSSASPMKV